MVLLTSRGARWLSGRVSDSGARGPGFETYRRRVVSLSKTLYSPKVLVNYPGSDGSVPIWLKNCWLGRKASTQPTNQIWQAKSHLISLLCYGTQLFEIEILISSVFAYCEVFRWCLHNLSKSWNFLIHQKWINLNMRLRVETNIMHRILSNSFIAVIILI